MALINITPVMTSNTTPSPYVVSASSFYPTREPYKAFDGITNSAGNSWALNTGNIAGWIKFDFGSEVECSAMYLTSRSSNPSQPDFVGVEDAPRSFVLYGSNNDTSYVPIFESTSETSWKPEETRKYLFSEDVKYRYYRLNILSNNGYSGYSALGEIAFYYNDTSKDPKIASFKYTLPFASKKKLDDLTSDLSYMLATENDGENFGTLRIVDVLGEFKIAKASQKIKILFDGSASAIANYKLLESIKNFQTIRIVANMTGVSGNRNSIAQDRTVSEILGKTGNDIMFALATSTSDFRKIAINFSDTTGGSFNVTYKESSSGTSFVLSIEKIYGIY